MRTNPISLVLLAFVVLASSCAAPDAAPIPSPATPEDGADIVILGTIRTLDDARPVAGALVLKGGVIERLTTAELAMSRVTTRTQVIRVPDGGVALPGFIESHAHLRGIGRAARELDLSSTTSEADAVSRVQATAAGAAPGTWILGGGWNQERWTNHAWPTRTTLDAVSGDHPVALSRTDGHALWANSAALAAAGITASTADPSGGEILRDATGAPSGVLVDNAMDLMSTAMAKASNDADAVGDMLRAQDEAVRNGITTLVDCGDSAESYLRLASLYDDGRMWLRVYGMLSCSTLADLDAVFSRPPLLDHHHGSLAVRAIKMYADGALGSRGAWLMAPYADREGHMGLPVTDRSVIDYAARGALKNGYQLCVHAIGDRANREVLNSFEEALRPKKDRPDHRFRVEHAQLVDPMDVPRFARLGVIPSMQPCHATSDGPWVGSRLGTERAERIGYRWRALLDSGAHVPAGTDAPVEPLSPLANVYSALTRRDPYGRMDQPFTPDQCMNRLEAILAVTRWGAEATFMERRRGRLLPGFDADVVILDHDILTCDVSAIPTTQVIATLVAGSVQYPPQSAAGGTALGNR